MGAGPEIPRPAVVPSGWRHTVHRGSGLLQLGHALGFGVPVPPETTPPPEPPWPPAFLADLGIPGPDLGIASGAWQKLQRTETCAGMCTGAAPLGTDRASAMSSRARSCHSIHRFSRSRYDSSQAAPRAAVSVTLWGSGGQGGWRLGWLEKAKSKKQKKN
jgi:hypothetical protein